MSAPSAAVRYCDLGLRVLPVAGKVATLHSWPTLATADPAEVDGLPWSTDSNIGVATGAGSGVFVLDVDPAKGGADSLAALIAEHGPLPSTWVVATGGGGEHYYFRHPGGAVKNRQNRPGRGLDIRGDGGYAVAPPSVHPDTGRRYCWAVAPDEHAPADAPDWLLNAIIPDEGPRGSALIVGTLSDSATVKRAAAYLAKMPPSISGNGGHDAAFKAACRLVQGFLLDPAVARALMDEFNQRCQPRWSKAELDHKIADALLEPLPAGKESGYLLNAPAPPGGTEPDGPRYFDLGDDVELGHDLAASIGGPAFAVTDEGEVYAVGGGAAWEIVPEVSLQQRAHTYSGDLRKAGLDKNGEQEWASIRLSAQRAKGIAQIAAVHLAVPGFFAAAPTGAAFADTFVRVEGTRLIYEPLSKEHRVRSTAVAPWPLGRPEDAAVVIEFLRETWAGCPDVEERIDYFLSWVGVALVGLATRYKDSPLLSGDKDTGKSEVLNLVAACFPPESRRSVALHNLAHQYDRAHLAGARLNVVSELPARELFNGEEAKAILSGDTVSARFVHGRVFDLRSRCAHIFAANKLPPTLDAALVGRFVLLDCPNVVPPHRQDRGLAARLEAAAPGFAAAALATVEATLARGYIERPPSSGALAQDWQRSSDPVQEWAEESIEPWEPGRVGSRELFDQFTAWASVNGHKKPLSNKRWSQRMQAIGFVKFTSDGARWRVRRIEPR